MEIMVYLGFFMLVFVFVLMFLLSDFNSDINRREYILAKQTAGQISDYTEFISNAGVGYWANFSVPQRISGKAYVVKFVSSGWLYVVTQNDEGLSFAYPTGHANIRQGWDSTDYLPNNKYKNYTDTEGILRHEVTVDASKGWIAFNYTTDANGPVLLVK